MKIRILPYVTALALVAIFCVSTAAATNEKNKQNKKADGTADSILEEPGRLFNIKVPKGFKAAALEVPGIIKWTKGDAEICLVVGDNFSKKGKKTFDVLYKAAKKDKRFEKVDRVKIRGGLAFVYKEKAPKDPSRLQTWRLTVITAGKIVNVDFSAPGKDFAEYVDQFNTAMKSFRLRLSGS